MGITCRKSTGKMQAGHYFVLLLPVLVGGQSEGLLGGLSNFLRSAFYTGGGRSCGKNYEKVTEVRRKVQGVIDNPKIQERLWKCKDNPCKGSPPSRIICDNGIEVAFSTKIRNPCSESSRAEKIKCRNGNIFTIRDEALLIAQRNGIPTCGRSDPEYCTCSNGDIFYPKSSDTSLDVYTGDESPTIEDCHCPDGSVITKADFTATLFPFIKKVFGGKC